ncbi:carbon-nitrogen hydrolase family protein [Acidipropionibacterium timonense]|uniref:carbon-nitrogen hydrolase family protein n=1 Tax=Acidipropionibacterium timonense TaxID=2161818 RepID=UPI00102FEA70|nr:carbon-nitrogen hydrolase family protein [Acidipropionibacterium timonense]
MTNLSLALVQFIAGHDPRANLDTIVGAIDDAARAGARLVVLPEAAMAGFGADLRDVAEPLDGPFATGVRRAAREAGVVAVVGMFTPAGARVRNTLLVTDGRGEDGVEERYDKIHLYDAFGFRESATVEAGDRTVVVEVDGVRIGLATCYDLRFGAHFTALGRAGAQLVVVPASWAGGPGKAEQWDVLTRARALDGQAWLAACDQAWIEPGARDLGVGLSRVVDPLGHVDAALGEGPGMLRHVIDLERVAQVRRALPVLD